MGEESINRAAPQDASGKKTPGGRPLVIAGTASGVGKTTLSLGLMGAFRRRGMRVAPFKVGPDYIDPGYHAAAAGVPSRNLDTWLTPPPVMGEIYRRGAARGDISIIEGVMGLFDGRAVSGAGDDDSGGRDGAANAGDGSTAQVARLLGGAVVLVVDCARMARSLAPLLAGYAGFDDGLDLAGAVLNNVGSAGHGRMLESAAAEAGVRVLGVLPRAGGVNLPSRHLGLVPAAERDRLDETLERLAGHIEANVDMGALAALAGGRNAAVPATAISGDAAASAARLAVARDQAFSFYYQDSLEELQRAGGRLVFFSPLEDSELPRCDGLYLGGGFPEMFAKELEANESMRRSLRRAAGDGLPIYAECGGLVYLSGAVEVDGRVHEMAGVIPARAHMTAARQALGYVDARARRDSILLEGGKRIHGHEFHWSRLDWPQDVAGLEAYDCFSPRAPGGRTDGFVRGNLLASYVHVHFAGYPGAARRFVDACIRQEGVGAGAVL